MKKLTALYTAMFFWGFVIVNTPYCSVPVLTELSVIGGTRGVAVSIQADGTIETDFVQSGDMTVTATVKNCMYGLKIFTYDKFSINDPVKKIEVSENAKKSEIQIKLYLRVPAETIIKKYFRENRWIALLSSTPSTDYRWNASEFASSVAVPESGKEYASVNDTMNCAKLKNIRIIRREKTCELAFEFDTVVESKLYRSNDSLVITFKNTSKGQVSDAIEIPAGTLYKKIDLAEHISEKNRSMDVIIVLDDSYAVLNSSLLRKKGTIISLYATHNETSKSIVWTAKNGLMWEFDFFNPRSFKSDTSTLKQRAKSDMEKELPLASIFPVQDKEIQFDQSGTIDTIITRKEIDKDSSASVQVPVHETLVVVSDSVNLREQPSIKSRVVSKIGLGSRFTYLNEQQGWIKIGNESVQGWLASKFLKDSSVVSEAEWNLINNKNAPVVVDVPQNDKAVLKSGKNDSMLKVNAVTAVKTIDIPVVQENGEPVVEKNPSEKNNVIRYSKYGRDPFLPLAVDGFFDSDSPAIENMKLVGILYDYKDQIALLEDSKTSRPFALREKDIIGNGKVLKIFKDKVIFLITEYGISRSHTLLLANSSNMQELGK